MSEQMYELEVKAYRYKRILNELVSKGNNTYTFTGAYKECSRMQRRLARRRIYGDIYKKNYVRNSTYRNTFFKETGDKKHYKCVYCGRIIPKYKVTVDHVVPVNSAKKSGFARFLLRTRGCSSVNDIKNLVASCQRCNYHKGTALNLIYLLRARYGNSSLYWQMVWLIRITVFVSLCYLGYMIYTTPEILDLVARQILDFLKKFGRVFV